MTIAGTIEEACDLVTDGTHYTPKNVESGTPFLTVKDVSNSGLDFIGCSFISAEDYQTAKEGNSAPQKGDVLFSKDGTVGKVHVVETDRPFAVLSSLAILRPKYDRVDAGYLGHALRSPSVLNDALKRKTGSAIRRVVLSDLKRVRLPLPPLSEQRRIADILDRADALRAKRRTAIAQLGTLSQAIFLDMFGDPTTNSKGWPETACLGDAAEIVSGVTKGRGLNGKHVRKVPYLAVINVQDRTLNLSNVKTIDATEEEINRYRLRKDDLLLTEGGDPDKVGRGTLWANELPECIHQNHVFRVRLITNLLQPKFLDWLIGSQRGKRYFLRSAKQTTGIASINMTQLRGFPLLFPPIGLQQDFATRIASLEQVKAAHDSYLAELNALFGSLQHRAFRAEL